MFPFFLQWLVPLLVLLGVCVVLARRVNDQERVRFWVKLLLLVVPLVGITWWFFGVEMGGESHSEGGGGYNLAGLYYPVVMLAYMMTYGVAMTVVWICEYKRSQSTRVTLNLILACICGMAAMLVYFLHVLGH